MILWPTPIRLSQSNDLSGVKQVEAASHCRAVASDVGSMKNKFSLATKGGISLR